MNPSAYAAPRSIYSESMAGCDPACIHCRRITVVDQFLPQDLNTQEAFDLIDPVAAFARPIFLVPVGCGLEIVADQQTSLAEYEQMLHWLYDAEIEGGIELKLRHAHIQMKGVTL